MRNLLQDLRYGLRVLARNPGFTAVAVVTLALGIGANTAIFSVLNAALLRPLPFRDPSSLIALHEGIPGMGYPKMGFSAPDFAIFVREQRSFSTLGAFRDEHVDLSGQGEPERVTAARVSASLFPMIEAKPMLGRTFAPEEDAMTQAISSSVAGAQFNTILVGTFAGLALFLAAIGVYGVLAYTVARRTHEIGIRMALGAKRADVLRLVVRQGLRLTLIGVAIGVVVALALTRFLASLLYGVKPTDPLTFVLVSVALTVTAVLACYIPARRATMVDPMVALRCE